MLALKDKQTRRSNLKSTDLGSFKHSIVESLPMEFNGNCIFEFPPLSVVKEEGACRLDGIDQKFD